MIRPFIFIGITSAPANLNRRMSQRESWLKDISKHTSKDFPIKYIFVLAQSADKHLMEQVQEEAEKYQDMIILPWLDVYFKLTQKVYEMTRQIFTTHHPLYLLKTDDDSYVYIDKIFKLLKDRWSMLNRKTIERQKQDRSIVMREEPNDPLYLGHMIHMATVPLVERYAIGAGYVIGDGIAEIFFNTKDLTLPFTPFEDGSMGLWVQEIEQRGHRVEYVHETRIQQWSRCAEQREALILHYVGPNLMRCIWQNIQKNDKSCCPNE